MIRKKKDEIEWLEFELLAQEKSIVHGTFLRHGGWSKKPFASLNCKQECDDPYVKKNLTLISKTLNLQNIIHSELVHGITIAHATHEKEKLFGDGIITNDRSLGLLITHADCQAALFYDPIQKAIANVHAGWRGQVKNIYQETIANMEQIFGSKAQNLLVCISPSLGPENSEFKHYKKEFPKELWKFQIKPTYFDLWALAHHQLLSCGVLAHHIEIAKIDTYANPQDFYSYRREKACGELTGCHGTVICLINK